MVHRLQAGNTPGQVSPAVCLANYQCRSRHFNPMLNPQLNTHSNCRSWKKLPQHPSLSRLIFADFGLTSNQSPTLIEPALEAPRRSEISPYYIHAVARGQTSFLSTNLPDGHKTCVTENGRKWLIGRSRNCSIFIPSTLVSRCHAVIAQCSEGGFYIMDVGSSNGTFVNRERLSPQDRRYLNDGDILEISQTYIEFFISGWHQNRSVELETQF